jgi:isopentenyldiphosphate isomerase
MPFVFSQELAGDAILPLIQPSASTKGHDANATFKVDYQNAIKHRASGLQLLQVVSKLLVTRRASEGCLWN